MNVPRPSRVVVSVHGPHALSGVSTWISRLLTSDTSRHDWRAIVVGSQDELRAMGSFPGDTTGRVRRLTWDANPRAAARRVDSLRAALNYAHAEVVVPNYVPEAFAAAALDAGTTRRTLGVCHSRDAWYLELFEHAGRALDAVWTVSSECTELINPALAIGTPLLEAPYAVPVSENPPAPPGVIDPNAPLRLVYLGRLDGMQKRVILLADFADELHRRGVRFHLSVAGDGPEHNRLHKRLAEHFRYGRAELLGALSSEESAALLARSDALILTSAYEGTPLAAIEAMATARPVLVTEGCGGACDAVRRFGGGAIVPREDPMALAIQAERFARDRAVLARASAEAHEAARTLYSPIAHASALDDLVDRAFDATPSSAQRPQEVWQAALRAAALGAERGPRDLVRRHRRAWRRGFVRASGAARLPLGRPTLVRTGSSLLLAAVNDLEQQGLSHIAVFPAGRHSLRHGMCLRRAGSVRCFVDDHPASRRLHGKPVLTPEVAIESGIDAIVISSDQHEHALAKCARGWAGERPVATLYIPVRLPALLDGKQSR